jgi:photosystem II stability/assembly factor-like uncharacterized protein
MMFKNFMIRRTWVFVAVVLVLIGVGVILVAVNDRNEEPDVPEEATLPATTESFTFYPYPFQSPYPHPERYSNLYPAPNTEPENYDPDVHETQTRPLYTPLPTRQYDSIFLISDVYFIDHQIGFVIGYSNLIGTGDRNIALRLTTDGGQSWQALPVLHERKSSEPISARWIRFISPEFGFAFGPGLFTTIDGGLTWENNSYESRELTHKGYVGDDVIALEVVGSNAWAIHRSCPEPHICNLELLEYHLQQGWMKKPIQPPLNGQIAQITAKNSQQIWIITHDYQEEVLKIVTTNDGGKSWQECQPPNKESWISFVLKVNPEGDLWLLHVGIAATSMSDKQLFVSKDGGQTWELRAKTFNLADALNQDQFEIGNLSIIGHPTSMSVPSSNRAFLAQGAWGTVQATHDGGLNWWNAIDYGPIAGVIGIGNVFFVDENYGWAVTQNYVFRTTDGGKNWKVSQVP